jgi:biopolymer transport protein TolR
MLVLLIIFMVTAPLITPSVIDLPSVGNAARQPDLVIQIIINKDESIAMKVQEKSSPLTLQSLGMIVKTAQGGVINSAVVISADKNTKYETVVKVMDALKRADVQRVGLSVQLAS